ncbi:hypothetical protein [Niabella hibiscisoli]|uniref:hypothetical protein n=1 Tax=Niabella hibiscisoli TaxID=1825928 RepID=UPI001F0FCD3D|nr:hypothetical protein [Niabella hibiscisoli]MCH5718829.1 hypothetical protein [Niabella hibiscisoli]
MKHTSIFLLLTLVLILCRCSKQHESGANASIEKSQLASAGLKNSALFTLDQKDSVKSISPIPSKFFDEVTELLKPVQENLDQIFKKMNPGLYESYQKDIEKLSQITADGERSRFAHSMKEKYYPFLKEGWAAAQIDEKSYKEKITGLLPDELRKLIRFDADFLNFYFDMLRPPQSNTWLPRMKDINQWDIDDHDDPTPPNTPPPPPPAAGLKVQSTTPI